MEGNEPFSKLSAKILRVRQDGKAKWQGMIQCAIRDFRPAWRDRASQVVLLEIAKNENSKSKQESESAFECIQVAVSLDVLIECGVGSGVGLQFRQGASEAIGRDITADEKRRKKAGGKMHTK